MITPGASVVTSPGSISQCKEVLTVILYKIREVGLWVVFLHLGDERLEEKSEGYKASTPRKRAVLSQVIPRPPCPPATTGLFILINCNSCSP